MQKIGRYNIMGELGRGAMSVVYRAQDPTIGREVALKVLSFGTSEAATSNRQEMFMREVRTAGRLAHPSIVTIHDAFEDPQSKNSCIVMELVPGKTLEMMLMSGQRLTIEQSLHIARQVAEGLDFAHRHQVVHRDLKPANILVTPDGQVKITDFGIAKVVAREGGARTVGMMGTPSYTSPEQIKGGDIDGRADLFSLGIILYLMLTGQKPFLGDTAAVMFKIVYEEPAAPSSLNLRLSPAFDALVMQCLAKDRSQRFATAADFLRELDKLAHPQPTQASVVSTPPGDDALPMTVPALAAAWNQSLQTPPAPDSKTGAGAGATRTYPAVGVPPREDGALELSLPILALGWSSDLAQPPASAPPMSGTMPLMTPTVAVAAVTQTPGTSIEPTQYLRTPPFTPTEAVTKATTAVRPASATGTYAPPSSPMHVEAPEWTESGEAEIAPQPGLRVNKLAMALGALAILALAAAALGVWKYRQIMNAEVSAPQIALVAPPPVPAELQPVERAAPPPPPAKKEAARPKKIVKVAVVPPPQPAAPPPQPVAAVPAPVATPPAPTAEEIARENAAKLASQPRVVQVHCSTDLKEATYTIVAGGQTLFQTTLKGKKRGGFLGIKGAYEAAFSRTVTVPGGVPEVSVRVITKDGATDLSRAIPMPAPGGFVPTLSVGVEGNKVSLAWEGSSGPKM